MTLACKNSSRYKGMRKPRCGCVACRLTWLERVLGEVDNRVDQNREGIHLNRDEITLNRAALIEIGARERSDG